MSSITPAGGANPLGGLVGGTGCVVCGLDQNANQILLCDGCDAEYHTYCLVPPLKEIPEGDFYCKRCKDAKRIASGRREGAASEQSLGAGSTPTAAATQAGFAVQDENGRMIPIRSEDVRESKYRGVLKLLQKGAKKAFVARIAKDGKYMQLGLYNSEIEAAHAFDKASIQLFGRSAQLNFPHLHEGFVRTSAATASSTTAAPAVSLGGQVRAAATQHATASPAVASPGFGTPVRGRGRGRGRGGAGRGSRGGATAGGRGKRRLEDSSPQRDVDAANGSAVKRRKAPAASTGMEVVDGPKYIGVQAFRGYSHAQIVVNGKTVNLGTFPKAMEAAIAYDKAALKYFGGDIGSKDASYDSVVLNFPNKRAELLKQLIEESMHQKARQASGSAATVSAPFNANRSMQSAKHNLSAKKLETWLLKLQRSVKLVEAAHRVRWDGLPLVKPEGAGDADDQPQDIKLELQATAGPIIKTEFTKKQQRLRTSAQHIDTAVKLMMEELKIYAESTPIDASFHPPPRSHVLLDLMSTSRFLKLCSTINELAHFDIKTGKSTDKATNAAAAKAPASFEAFVQSVVDYRTRLQMATSSEKLKLQALVDSDGASVNATDAGKGDADVMATSETKRNDAVAVLQRAKYVKRKVQRIRRVPRAVVPEAIAPSESIVDDEQKEAESVEAAEDSAMQVEEDAVAKETSEPAAAVESKQDETVVNGDVGAGVEAESKEEEAGDAVVAAVVVTTAEDAHTAAVEAEDTVMAEVASEKETTERDGAESQESKTGEEPASSNGGDEQAEVTTTVLASPEAVAVPSESEQSTAIEPVADLYDTVVEDAWEYCLAIQPQPPTGRTTSVETDEQPWRLIPLDSDTGEFIKDVFLSDSEVAALQVSDAEVCGDGKPNLGALHQHELALRGRIKAEMDRRQSLEGVIKIEQERLSQVFVVYRRMLEGIMVKSSEVQKKHQRIARDVTLVQLMKESFAPILDDLLTQCEAVFLERLEKLSDRFDDFQQEFEYYTDALLSVSGSEQSPQPNGHMKAEAVDVASPPLPSSPSELSVVGGDGLPLETDDDDSTGLRGAYVSFYMEEIEALWKERCHAVESLLAILRSLPSPVESEAETATSPSLFRRRVEESVEQWKTIQWPSRLATPAFVASFAMDGAHRVLPASSSINQPDARAIPSDETVSALGELKQIIIDLTQEGPQPLSQPSSTRVATASPSTLVVYHPVFLEHQTPKDHPECPERLNRIITMLGTVRKKFEGTMKIVELAQSPEELTPSESVLVAVHSPAYLEQLKSRAVEASVRPTPTPSLVFETNRGVVDLTPSKKSPSTTSATNLTSPTGSMTSAFGAASMLPSGVVMDTYVSAKSWDVARAAAGTVCLAVDKVLRQEFRNAACLVRPPGHHVGRHGRTLDAPSSGFCLLNNVVIGAVHARQYPWIRRVAVLDWDIHHGNGTEELMKDDADGFFASIHLYASGKFFPGTGKAEQQENLVNVALENSGAGSGSAVFRSALQDQILPAMRAFRPDIIFISAGFDGHKDDILGGRAAVKNAAVPAGYLEEDYAWATQQVLLLADECCDGRVVSVLEGGYDVRKETNSLAKSVAAHVTAIAAYEQERRQRAETEVDTPVVGDAVKKEEEPSTSIGGLLRSLLAKSLDDEDVIIVDEDDDDDDDDEFADKSESHAVDGEDEEEEEEEGMDEELEEDGVEVEEDDDDDDHHHELDGDVVMTDEDHELDHSVDGGDDGDGRSSADLSFSASFSVEDEEEDSSHRAEELATGTPELNGVERAEDADEDDDMMGDHHGVEDEGHADDLLGEDDDDELA